MKTFLRLLPITLSILILGELASAPDLLFGARQLARKLRQTPSPAIVMLVRTRFINYQPRTFEQMYCDVVETVNAVWSGGPDTLQEKQGLIQRLLDYQLRHDTAMRKLLGQPPREDQHWSQRLRDGVPDPLYIYSGSGIEAEEVEDDGSTTYEPA